MFLSAVLDHHHCALCIKTACKSGHPVYNNDKDYNFITLFLNPLQTGEDVMKSVLTRILRPFVKALYRLVIKIRRAIRKRSALPHKKGTMPRPAGQSVATARVTPVYASAGTGKRHVNASSSPVKSALWKQIKAFFNRKNWWKTRPAIAGAGAVVVVVAVVLVVALTAPSVNAGSANLPGDSYVALINSVDVQSTSVPSASPSAPEVSLSPLPTTAEPTETEDTAPTSVPTTKPTEAALVPGVHDERVVEIQSRLMELGYMDNDEPTDYYGGGTKFALQLFQRKHNLQIDGLLGENTKAALFSDDAQPYTVKLGDKGTDVKEIQERLKELKYFSGSATGEFGEKTESAVKAFQKRNGLSTDGNIGEHTRDILFSEDAKEAKTSSGSGKTGSSGNSGKSGSSGNSGSSGSSGSSGGSKSGPAATSDPDASKADALIEFAQTLLGKEYTRGGKGPNEFDCSGYVYYCLNHSGAKSIKYMTSGTWAKSSYPRIDKISDLKRGDIICFKGHVGIYMGGGKMIHASSSSDKVVIGNATSSWSKRNFICGRRVL
jgi:peptidoglycan hydrolase-like protein with peptidoglycan-binding domain